MPFTRVNVAALLVAHMADLTLAITRINLVEIPLTTVSRSVSVFQVILDYPGPRFPSIYGVHNEPQHEISNNVVCATSNAQSDQSLCYSLEYPITVKSPTEQHLEFLGLKAGCIDSSESIHVKMPHCWKSHATTHRTLVKSA